MFFYRYVSEITSHSLPIVWFYREWTKISRKQKPNENLKQTYGGERDLSKEKQFSTLIVPSHLLRFSLLIELKFNLDLVFENFNWLNI